MPQKYPWSWTPWSTWLKDTYKANGNKKPRRDEQRRWFAENAAIVWPHSDERPTLRQALLHAKGYKLRPDGVIAEYWQKRRAQEKSGEPMVRQPNKAPGGLQRRAPLEQVNHQELKAKTKGPRSARRGPVVGESFVDGKPDSLAMLAAVVASADGSDLEEYEQHLVAEEAAAAAAFSPNAAAAAAAGGAPGRRSVRLAGKRPRSWRYADEDDEDTEEEEEEEQHQEAYHQVKGVFRHNSVSLESDDVGTCSLASAEAEGTAHMDDDTAAVPHQHPRSLPPLPPHARQRAAAAAAASNQPKRVIHAMPPKKRVTEPCAPAPQPSLSSQQQHQQPSSSSRPVSAAGSYPSCGTKPPAAAAACGSITSPVTTLPRFQESHAQPPSRGSSGDAAALGELVQAMLSGSTLDNSKIQAAMQALQAAIPPGAMLAGLPPMPLATAEALANKPPVPPSMAGPALWMGSQQAMHSMPMMQPVAQQAPPWALATGLPAAPMPMLMGAAAWQPTASLRM